MIICFLVQGTASERNMGTFLEVGTRPTIHFVNDDWSAVNELKFFFLKISSIFNNPQLISKTFKNLKINCCHLSHIFIKVLSANLNFIRWWTITTTVTIEKVDWWCRWIRSFLTLLSNFPHALVADWNTNELPNIHSCRQLNSTIAITENYFPHILRSLPIFSWRQPSQSFPNLLLIITFRHRIKGTPPVYKPTPAYSQLLPHRHLIGLNQFIKHWCVNKSHFVYKTLKSNKTTKRSAACLSHLTTTHGIHSLVALSTAMPWIMHS